MLANTGHTSLPAVRVLALAATLLGAQRVAAQDPGPEAELARTRTFLSVVPDAAAVDYRLAILEAQLGHKHQALLLLKSCLGADEGFDPSESPTLRKFAGTPAFDEQVQALNQRYPAIANAKPAFDLAERGLFPEGIAYDQARKVWYVGSLNLRKILEVRADGTAKDFVPAGRDKLLGILGIRVNERDHSVWAASWSEASNSSELLHFSAGGELLGRYRIADSATHGFNDLVTLPNGEVLLTDTAFNRVYRFKPLDGSFSALSTPRPLSAPNGIAISDNGREVFVADDYGVTVLEPERGGGRQLNRGTRNTLAGIDGLYWYRESLLAVQNDIGSPRIVRFKLSKDHSSVTETIVLERRTPFSALPTTGAIVGDEFYFMENTQIDNFQNDRIVDEKRIQPVHVGVLKLH